MSKTLWAKWRGDEAQEEYKVKGNVKVEVATSERVQSHNLAIDVTFDELPF